MEGNLPRRSATIDRKKYLLLLRQENLRKIKDQEDRILKMEDDFAQAEHSEKVVNIERDDTSASTEEINVSVYIFASSLMFWTGMFILGFFYYILMIIDNLFRFIFLEIPFINLLNQIKFMIMFLISIFIYLGLLTPMIAVIIMQYLLLQVVVKTEEHKKENMLHFSCKAILILILVILVVEECSQAIKALFYSCMIFPKRAFKDRAIIGYVFGSPLAFFPAIMQFMITVYIYYSSLLLILTTTGVVDLVQNFAGLAIILEFDNFIFTFIRTIKLHWVLISGVNLVKRIFEEENNQEMVEKVEYVVESVKMLFHDDTARFDAGEELHPILRSLFYLLNTSTICLLFIYGLYRLFWMNSK